MTNETYNLLVMHHHAPQVKCYRNSFSVLRSFAGAHEHAELIGWIQLNQDNSAIEDKAIPLEADNRMLSGEQETEDRPW